MRRMYSVKELTDLIKEVFDAELASGALDQKVSDAVDAYLLANPVDITALEGKDIEVKSIEATDAIKYLNKIIDENNKSRFIQGDGTANSLAGYTASYCKWSLSGTHLMCVIAGTIEDAVEVPANFMLAEFTLPAWISNKIFPVWGNNLQRLGITLTGDDWSTQSMDAICLIDNIYGVLKIGNLGNSLTLTATRHFRVQIDLLID